MPVHCSECGYENRDSYRFCGMCGGSLRTEAPAAQTPAVQQAAKAQPTPSVRITEVAPEPLRIARPEEPTRSLDYLLEDEPPKSHGKLYLTLALLLLAGGLMAWHWNRDGYPWSGASPASSSNASAPSGQTSQNATPAPSTVSDPRPASPPANSAPTPVPNEQPKPASPEPQESAKSTAPSAPETKGTVPQNPAEEKDQVAPESSAPAENSGATIPANDATSPDSTAPETKKAEPDVAVPTTPAVEKPKPAPIPSAQPTRALRGDDKLVADGEKYLYGNGVPENCDVAQRNIKVAAGHSDARALSLLGSMYATGHCVSRDLPTAYRWFAKALHQDPSNSRVQQDLEIIWRQMTSGERQLATKSGD